MIKKIFASLLAAVSASSAAQPAAKVETIPTNLIQFSMSTIAVDDIEFVMPTPESFEGAPQFHEDEWSQLEFFPKERLGELQRTLKELKAFEVIHRTKYGWSDIYKRKFARSPIVGSAQGLALEFSVKNRSAPILTASGRPLGQVKNGFSIELGKNAYLYGIETNEHVTVLAAYLQGADDMLLTNAFSNLSKRHGLILVDWRQQFVLVSVRSDGQFELWRP